MWARVPPGAVLIGEQDGRAVGGFPRREPGRLELHERHEAVYLRLARHELRDDTAQPQSLGREVASHPPVARRRAVALRERQVDDAEHRAEPLRQLRRVGHLEGHVGRRERLLRPHDALLDRRDRHEEHPRDLLRDETRDDAQRERHLSLPRQHGVARREHEPQQVVGDRLPLVLRRLLEVAGEDAVALVEPLPAAPGVDRLPLRDGREPGTRVVRDARLRPLRERVGDGVLREVLGEAEVARHPGEGRDDPRPLDAPDRGDPARDVGHRRPVTPCRAPCATASPSRGTRCPRTRRSRSRR